MKTVFARAHTHKPKVVAALGMELIAFTAVV